MSYATFLPNGKRLLVAPPISASNSQKVDNTQKDQLSFSNSGQRAPIITVNTGDGSASSTASDSAGLGKSLPWIAGGLALAVLGYMALKRK